MRLLLDANILLDCLILESDESPRTGREASATILDLCDRGVHHGLVAWHTLPIVSFYHGKLNEASRTGAMIDALLRFLETPTVGHLDAQRWRATGVADFEDALQVAAALAGRADFVVTRNLSDFHNAVIPAVTPEVFLSRHP